MLEASGLVRPEKLGRVRTCRIVPNERIIYTYEMKAREQRMSVSLAVVEFHVVAAGTRLT